MAASIKSRQFKSFKKLIFFDLHEVGGIQMKLI
jgi:hypothetical protein